MKHEKFLEITGLISVIILAGLVVAVVIITVAEEPQSQARAYEWEDTGFRVHVERLSDEEANAYYDGRKLVNDNQRNYIDNLAEEGK